MKAILDEVAIRVAYAAALSSDARPVLQHVRIGDGKIVASDGFILAERKITTEPETGEAMLVDAKTILQAARMFKCNYLTIESHDSNSATIKSIKSMCMIDVPLLQATFPSYEQIFPQGESKAYVALQVHYLALIAKIMGMAENPAAKIKVREPTSPIEVYNDETKLLLMPYFTSGE